MAAAWWCAELAQERELVWAMRWRYQRCRDFLLLRHFGTVYYQALRIFIGNVAGARDAAARGLAREALRSNL